MPIQVLGQFEPDFVKERHARDRVGFLQTVWRRTMTIADFQASPPLEIPRDDIVHVRTEVEMADGVAVVRHYYDGLPTNYRKDLKVWEFSPSFDEVPIQAHHNFGGPDGDENSLFKKYRGYYDGNGNLRWAPAPKSGGKQTRGFAALGSAAEPVGGGAGEIKSLQGVESYLRMGGTWRIIYPWREDALPNGLFYGVGTIRRPLDGYRLPSLPAKRNWLKGPPSARWRGNAWEITEEYILSGVGGWLKDIYDGSTEGKASE